ncbi:MAG: sulfotransferase domain-containing protein [Pseudomonadales bacterium]
MLVWLASYPRSGNTFVRVLLHHAFGLDTYSIYNDPVDIAADAGTSNLVGHRMLPEGASVESLRSRPEVCVVKTHDHPPDNDDPAIYVIRDGRECAVSYAHYRQDYNDLADLQNTLEDVVLGRVPFGSWGQHVTAWSPGSRANTLLLRFEALIADPQSHVEQIADFLGRTPNTETLPTFTDLQGVNRRFFRKGNVDSWRSELSDELQILFWLKNGDQLLEFEYAAAPPPELARVSHQSLVRKLADSEEILWARLAQLQTEKSSLATRLEKQARTEQLEKLALVEEFSQRLLQRDDSIQDLKQQIKRHRAQDLKTQETLEQLRKRRNELQDEKTQLEETIEKVRRERTQLRDEVSRLTQRLSDADQHAEQLRTEFNRIQERLAETELAHSETRERLENATELLTEISGMYQAALSIRTISSPIRKLEAYRTLSARLGPMNEDTHD